jgi:hypothetical protein
MTLANCAAAPSACLGALEEIASMEGPKSYSFRILRFVRRPRNWRSQELNRSTLAIARCGVHNVCGSSAWLRKLYPATVSGHPTVCTSKKWLQHPRRLGAESDLISPTTCSESAVPLEAFNNPVPTRADTKHCCRRVIGAESVTKHGYG